MLGSLLLADRWGHIFWMEIQRILLKGLQLAMRQMIGLKGLE